MLPSYDVTLSLFQPLSQAVTQHKQHFLCCIKFIDKISIYVKLERETTCVVASGSVGEVWHASLHFGLPIFEHPHYKFLLLAL